MAAYSICIPRVFANIRWKRVKGVFEQLGLGDIDRVDLVSRTNENGDNFQRCFIHFKSWADTDNARAVQDELDKGGNIKVIYDDPWFWKCFKSRVARPDQAPKSSVRRQPTIELEGGKIIRSAQRAGARKVRGRGGGGQNRHGQPWKERDPARDSVPTTPPAPSTAADEFLAQLSAAQQETSGVNGTLIHGSEVPSTPPGSPTGASMRAPSPTELIANQEE
jgi:hypothetical protein